MWVGHSSVPSRCFVLAILKYVLSVDSSNGILELHKAIGSTMGFYSWKGPYSVIREYNFVQMSVNCWRSIAASLFVNSLSAIIAILYTTVKGYLILQCKSHSDDISLQGLDLIWKLLLCKVYYCIYPYTHVWKSLHLELYLCWHGYHLHIIESVSTYTGMYLSLHWNLGSVDQSISTPLK